MRRMQLRQTTQWVLLAALLLGMPVCLYAASSESDYQARCNGPGVVVCQGFENASEFTQPRTGYVTGYHTPFYGDQLVHGFQDSAIKLSGTYSLRMECPSGNGGDCSGSWNQNHGADQGAIFGQNTTYYVQFAMRFSSTMLTTNFQATAGGNTAPKQVIMHGTDGTCSSIELTMHRYIYQSNPFILEMYSQCGQIGLCTNNCVPPYSVQQGYWNCPYGGFSPSVCFVPVADKWYTFYYRWQFGTFGSANSNLQAWVAWDGGPYRQFINLPNFRLEGGGLPGYSIVTFTSYMTDKSSSQSHATANVWYDELIVSTQPIPAPGSSAPAESPASPANLRVQ